MNHLIFRPVAKTLERGAEIVLRHGPLARHAFARPFHERGA